MPEDGISVNNMVLQEAYTEEEVRALRAKVYCSDCTDKTWEEVRANWMKPDAVRWLVEHARIDLKFSNSR